MITVSRISCQMLMASGLLASVAGAQALSATMPTPHMDSFAGASVVEAVSDLKAHVDFARGSADALTLTGVLEHPLALNEDLHELVQGRVSLDMSLTSGLQVQFASALRFEPTSTMVLHRWSAVDPSNESPAGRRVNVSDVPLMAAVPENSTLAMLVTGMFGIGFVTRHRMSR